jgi:hypothetical protein
MMSKFRNTVLAGAAALAMAGFSGGAVAAVVAESEPNDTLPTAQNIDSFFDVFFDVNIEDFALTNTSTTIPHAQVHGTGDGTFDWYSFTVPFAGALGIFDIDCGAVFPPGGGIGPAPTTCTSTGSVDTFIRLFDSDGTVLADNNDQFFVSSVDTGSQEHYSGPGFHATVDSFIEVFFGAPGLYYLQVGSAICCGPSDPDVVPSGSDYILNVSIEGHALTAVPEPAGLALFCAGLAALGFARRHRGTVGT